MSEKIHYIRTLQSFFKHNNEPRDDEVEKAIKNNNVSIDITAEDLSLHVHRIQKYFSILSGKSGIQITPKAVESATHKWTLKKGNPDYSNVLNGFL